MKQKYITAITKYQGVPDMNHMRGERGEGLTEVLVVRKHVRGERANVQFNLKELAEKQVQRKLDMRALRVEEQLEQYRESYARSMVEWNVQVRCHTDLLLPSPPPSPLRARILHMCCNGGETAWQRMMVGVVY